MAENLPETQLYVESQDTSQTFFSFPHTAVVPVWARLTFHYNSKIEVELRSGKASFGRAPESSDTSMLCFEFKGEMLQKHYFERISKEHFTIEKREKQPADGEQFCGPAFITCKGRNGLYVNGEKLGVDESRILGHNDLIMLTRNIKLFKFCYAQVPLDYNLLPKEALEKYFVGPKIGSGGCGYVHLVYNRKTFEKLAMKVIKKETNPMVQPQQAIDENQKILNEVNIMRKLSNPHVLGLVDFYETAALVTIIMDYMEGRDMLHRILKYDVNRTRLDENDAKFFFLQACRGLKYLHDANITHRDIKPDNILLSSDSPDALLKISDFGLSKSIAAMQTVCGTQIYVAPEVLKMNGKYTNSVDIWSMGILLYAMLSGSVPFFLHPSRPSIADQIKKSNVSFNSSWNHVSKKAIELIRKMLQKDPVMRPSIDEVIGHPWLKCPTTINRVQRLYQSGHNETLMLIGDESIIEQTMLNVTLSDAQKEFKEPAAKKRRVEK